MENNYLIKETKIIAKKQETSDIYLFTLKLSTQGGSASGGRDGSILNFNPGQFILAGIPGFGESAFDVCSPPTAFCPLGQQRNVPQGHGVLPKATAKKQTFQICVRNVGVNTAKMVALKIGDSIFIRGPFGNGFPLEKFRNKNLLMIGGGTGIIVIRGLLQHFLTSPLPSGDLPQGDTPPLPLFKGEGKGGGYPRNPRGERGEPISAIPYPKIQIFYGARDWNSLLFKDEFDSWKKIASVHLILENPDAKSPCSKGLITELFKIAPILEKPTIIMCGPPVMYKFCLQKINEKLRVPENEIYLSLERRMHCGIGVCQHCAIGEKYVCKDGPVFTYEEIKNIKGAL